MARSLPFAGVVGVLLLSLSACKNQQPPAPEASAEAAPTPLSPASATADTAAPAAADLAPITPAASKYSELAFELELKPKGDYAAGKAAEAEIVLNAKAPFHVNQQYPYKFKLKASPGVTYPNMVVAKDAVKLEPARATLPVAFTPEAGKHTVSGQLSFSVCTDDKCVIEKRDLTLEIQAK
ncbi:MAG: hypothetical protein ABJB12_03930 [Pseudomonadota bacterium]